jgi:hypothetical protein
VTGERQFGEVPKFSRQWVVEVDSPTTSQTDISNAPGVVFLDSHPEAGYSRAMQVRVDNYSGSKWHYAVTWIYEIPKVENTTANPLSRPDVWKFSTSGMSIPALWYYDANNNRNALVNSAGDFFEGATTDLSTLNVHISGNRSTFSYALATAATNTLNNAAYLGGAPYCWKCDGIAGEQAVEVANDAELRYWKVEVQLTYRPDGWPLLLPNVGYNFVSGGQKKRAYVIDADTGDKVAAANPQPLNSDGSLQTSYGESNPPIIITRRVHAATDFASLFGSPPF